MTVPHLPLWAPLPARHTHAAVPVAAGRQRPAHGATTPASYPTVTTEGDPAE